MTYKGYLLTGLEGSRLNRKAPVEVYSPSRKPHRELAKVSAGHSPRQYLDKFNSLDAALRLIDKVKN